MVHESQRKEIPGRQIYLYDVFHLFFLPREQEAEYIPLTPVGHVDLNILFITGHVNQVYLNIPVGKMHLSGYVGSNVPVDGKHHWNSLIAMHIL